MSGGSGEQQLRRGRGRRVLFVAVGGALIAALAARLWLFEEPPQRLELEVPRDATFHYARFVEFQDETGSGVVWHRSVIPADSGRRLIDLVQQSEQQEYGTWNVRFDWPPFLAEYEPIPHRASFSVAASPRFERNLRAYDPMVIRAWLWPASHAGFDGETCPKEAPGCP